MFPERNSNSKDRSISWLKEEFMHEALNLEEGNNRENMEISFLNLK